MAEEKEEKKKEEGGEVSFLDSLNIKKIDLDKSLEEARKMIHEFKELKAQEVISGRSSAGQGVKEDEKIDPVEYANKVLRGEV